MSDLDHTSLDRILPPSSGSADWDDVLRRAGRGRERRGRRLVGVVAALLVLVVGTASAFGVRDLFANQPHAQRSFYPTEGKRGSFTIRFVSMRDAAGDKTGEWRILPEPQSYAESVSVPATGQYVQVSGRGQIVRARGHAQAWSARLVGFMSHPGEAKQRVVITMKGRPKGVFVLTPLQPGFLKRDSGTHEHTATMG